MNKWKNTCKEAALYYLQALYWHLPRGTMKTSSEDTLSRLKIPTGTSQIRSKGVIYSGHRKYTYLTSKRMCVIIEAVILFRNTVSFPEVIMIFRQWHT
jgi:hypothetical protein